MRVSFLLKMYYVQQDENFKYMYYTHILFHVVTFVFDALQFPFGHDFIFSRRGSDPGPLVCVILTGACIKSITCHSDKMTNEKTQEWHQKCLGM